MTGVLEPRVTVLMTASLAPFQITLTPYASESGALCQKSKEYYNKHDQLCCAACPPGERQIEAGCLDGGTMDGVLAQAWGRRPSVLTGLLLIPLPWAFTYDVPYAQHTSPCLLLDNTYLHFRFCLLPLTAMMAWYFSLPHCVPL